MSSTRAKRLQATSDLIASLPCRLISRALSVLLSPSFALRSARPLFLPVTRAFVAVDRFIPVCQTSLVVQSLFRVAFAILPPPLVSRLRTLTSAKIGLKLNHLNLTKLPRP